jgi:F0F1-type ATP synthase assembly protein I
MTAMLLKMSLPRLSMRASLRVLMAGSAWGVIFSGGMVAYALANCGFVCLDDAALMTATSVAAGIVTIGPLAAFGRTR